MNANGEKGSGIAIRAPAVRPGPARGGSFRRRITVLLVIVGFVLAGLGLVVLFIPQASAAVGIGVTGGCTQTATNTNTCTITMSGSLTSGRTVLVGVSSPGLRSVSSITGGGTYSQRNTLTNTVYGAIWSTTVGGGTGGTSSVVVTMNGNGRFVAWATEYTGITFFGHTFPTNSGSTANPTISFTIHDGNNWLVAILTNTGTAPTALTGNLRDARAATGVSQGYVDNTAGTPDTSVTDAVTHAATAWTAVAIELRTSAACGHGPTFTYSSGSQVTFHPSAPLAGAATAADGQGAGTPAITATNQGPSTCNIGIARQSAAPTGVEDQFNNVNTAPGSGTNDITLSAQTVCASVADGGTCTIYLWSRVTASGSTPPNTYSNTYIVSET